MNKIAGSNTVKKHVRNLRAVEPVPAPELDLPELKTSLAKAMCRQYIMWPSDGPLPCEREVSCDKRSQCVEISESVLDYRRNLATMIKD